MTNALMAEGEAMLRAVVADLRAIGDLDIVVARDDGLPPLPDGIEILRVADNRIEERWSDCITTCDAALIVAPETGGFLERLNRIVIERPIQLLGCGPDAVAITASKFATTQCLARAGIPVVETLPWSETASAGMKPAAHGWIVKPDDGVGSQDVVHLRDRRALAGVRPVAGARVIQPYVAGRAMSLTVLCAAGGARVMACNEQLQSRHDEALMQIGVIVNGAAERIEAMATLAGAVVAAIPGLRGYVGIDLIDAEGGPVVLEVNPRLTTAYVGLSQSLQANAAALMLDALTGDDRYMHRRFGREPVRVEFHP
jgi:predicted ATP-grasp superfamily ATP-dependent carboligase